MSETLTNKQLLEQIREEQRENAELMFQNAQMFSNFMNKQERLNTKLVGYLESNDATKQEGVIEKLGRVEKQVVDLKTSIDKKIAYFTGAGLVLVSVGKWVISKIFI